VGVCKLLITVHDISLRHLLIAIGYGQLLCLAMKPWNLHVHESTGVTVRCVQFFLT